MISYHGLYFESGNMFDLKFWIIIIGVSYGWFYCIMSFTIKLIVGKKILPSISLIYYMAVLILTIYLIVDILLK